MDRPIAGRKVLVVDDDEAVIRRVRDVLAPCGYVFVEARDGREALARVRDERPDAVVMDVEMPGLGGLETCRILKANGAPGSGVFGFVPVLLMTSRGIGAKIEGLELGADDWLSKPLDPLELSARVKSMVRLKVLQDDLLRKMGELDRLNAELVAKRRELEKVSRTDALTGLMNRGYYDERFAGEFERSRRYRAALGCLMIDVDRFKSVNDTHGHPFGDEVLRAVAEVLRATLRDVDLVARYGGEEFVALLPETGLEQAVIAGERVRAAVAARELVDPAGRPLRVTVSVGVAAHPGRGVESRDDLVRAADEALYRAKTSGRDRVCSAEA
jgi:diguanylate cyclase (GGDEF)-like protein